MLFNSFDFLFIFLPVSLTLFYSIYKFSNDKNKALLTILISSLIFYGNHNINHLYIFIFSITTNYLIGKKLSNENNKEFLKKKEILLAVGIIFNIGILFIFKYYNFFIFNLSFLGLNFSKSELILPIGISFYTFQQIGYLIDSFKNKSKKNNIFDYATFVSFFPQLISGPIVHHARFIDQIKRKSFQPINFTFISNGIAIFIIALFKKVIIADNLYKEIVEPFYSNISGGDLSNFLITWICTIAYSLQIYFDFSAYSEMAIGLGLLFGITLPINFNSPFQAKSLIDYWSRWNITLSNFISDYVYLPIFKRLSYKSSSFFNNHIKAIILSMTISGFWHGANFNFLIWGFIHGIALAINHLLKANKISISLPPFFSRILLLVFINISFIFFRTNDLTHIKLVILSFLPFKKYFLNSFGFSINSIEISVVEIILLILILILVLFSPSTLNLFGYTELNNKEIKVVSFLQKFNLNKIQILIFSSLLTILFLISLSQMHNAKQFIYFQF